MWHPKVVAWWESIWRSPMAVEFTDADRQGGLALLAELYQIRWNAQTAADILDVASEIRLQERRYGLDAMARRALQWEIERSADARAPGRGTTTASPRRPAKDPLKALRLA